MLLPPPVATDVVKVEKVLEGAELLVSPGCEVEVDSALGTKAKSTFGFLFSGTMLLFR